MPKLTDLRDRFDAAVTAHASLRTFHSGLVTDVERLLRNEFPIFVLEPPASSTITDYRRSPFEVYDVRFWLIMQQKQAEGTDDVWNKLEWMKDWGHDIIDTVISRETLPAYYSLAGNVEHANWAYGLTPGTVAVRFDFELQVKDCRTQT